MMNISFLKILLMFGLFWLMGFISTSILSYFMPALAAFTFYVGLVMMGIVGYLLGYKRGQGFRK